MLERERVRIIAGQTWPNLAGMLSGNILALVDTAMVGVLGDAALAATGLGGVGNAFAISAVFGLSAAVQAIVSRREGAGRRAETGSALSGGLLLALVLGLPTAILLGLLAPTYFSQIQDSQEVASLGVPYWRALLLALPALGMNFAFRGFWQGIGEPARYMRTLWLIHGTNISLNYLLIYGKFGFPELGCFGAGLASCIAAYVGSLYYLIQSLAQRQQRQVLTGLPEMGLLKRQLGLALPVGAQNLMMGLGGMVLLAMVAQIGTAEVAATNVLLKFTRVMLFPAVALGFAARTLVGQALGRAARDDANRWGIEICLLGCLVLGLLALPLVLVPKLVLSWFIHDSMTLELAVVPTRIMGSFAVLGGLAQILLYTLQGVGDSRYVMVVSVALNWFFYIPLAGVLALFLGTGLLGIFSAQAAFATAMCLALGWRWRSGRWQREI